MARKKASKAPAGVPSAKPEAISSESAPAHDAPPTPPVPPTSTELTVLPASPDENAVAVVDVEVSGEEFGENLPLYPVPVKGPAGEEIELQVSRR